MYNCYQTLWVRWDSTRGLGRKMGAVINLRTLRKCVCVCGGGGGGGGGGKTQSYFCERKIVSQTILI